MGNDYQGTGFDVWSAGVTLYTLCAGQFPVSTSSPFNQCILYHLGSIPSFPAVTSALPPLLTCLYRNFVRKHTLLPIIADRNFLSRPLQFLMVEEEAGNSAMRMAAMLPRIVRAEFQTLPQRVRPLFICCFHTQIVAAALLAFCAMMLRIPVRHCKPPCCDCLLHFLSKPFAARRHLISSADAAAGVARVRGPHRAHAHRRPGAAHQRA